MNRRQFTGITTSRSPEFEHIAPVDSWTFYGSRYTSPYLSFVPLLMTGESWPHLAAASGSRRRISALPCSTRRTRSPRNSAA